MMTHPVPFPPSVYQESEYQVTKKEEDIYPNFVKMADSFGIPARRVIDPSELRGAIRYAEALALQRLAACSTLDAQ